MKTFYNLIMKKKSDLISEEDEKINKYISRWEDDIIEYTKNRIEELVKLRRNSIETLEIIDHFVYNSRDYFHMMPYGFSSFNETYVKAKVPNSERDKEHLNNEQKRKVSKWIMEYFKKEGFEILIDKHDACGCSGIEYDYSVKSDYTTYLCRYVISW